MKTITDPRHKRRMRKFKQVFAYSFNEQLPDEPEEGFASVIENLGVIDNFIVEVAPDWPVNRLNRIDLAILRVGIYELLLENKIPPKVVIDEAVELGKEYGSDSTAKFVNGVLGTLMEKYKRPIVSEINSETLEMHPDLTDPKDEFQVPNPEH